MDKEELKLYVKKSCENILKQLAENPKEMLDLLKLQDKYNNLLKEKIELKRQIKKKSEVIDKAKLYINSTKYSDITGLEKHSIKEFWFIEELLDILNEV
jgi:hypothetical protein